jgi:hypothetical protein
VIRHPSISKLHAHIRALDDGSYVLTDLGSRNGTRIRDHVLAPNKPETLTPNSVVIFGTVAAHALDARTLHGALLRWVHLLNPKASDLPTK